MVRINLLPRELQERRKYERYYPLVILVSAVALFIIVAAWGLAFFQVGQRNSDLQKAQETTQQLRTQADAFSVFERKEGELNARKQVSLDALDGRINWARIGTEVSMLLPEDTWLEQFLGNEDTGIQLDGRIPNLSPGADAGFKSLAKGMVRLNAIADIDDVWLVSARSDPDAESYGQEIIRFQVKTAVRSSAASSAP